MPTRLSKALGLSHTSLNSAGAYDTLIDFDSPLHIDPALIQVCKEKEFKEANKKLVLYFSKVLRILQANKKPADLFWKEAVKLMTFGEGVHNSIGYSDTGTKGSGIGKGLAIEIISAIKQIQDAGANDPLIFELVGVFQTNVGPDRISDMISVILFEEFLSYTERICNMLNLKDRKTYIIKGKQFQLPTNPLTQDYVSFIPKSILSDLPIASRWDDVEVSSYYNTQVRNKMNDIIKKSWREAAHASKEDLKELFISSPDLVKEWISLYKKRKKVGYDFDLDHFGELLWDSMGYKYADSNKVNLSKFKPLSESNLLALSTEICIQFKDLVENNGLVEHLYDANGKRRPERFAQLLLFAVADSYCKANDLDLSRETNAGIGSLDFKLSRGLTKVSIEIKFSDNGKLVEGYEKQLKSYNKAESIRSKNSIYLILKSNDNNDYKISLIKSMIQERKRMREDSPSLLVIDAIKHPPASKR